MRRLMIMLLSYPFLSFGQAASKDSITVWLAPANAATIALNNTYKNTFTKINNQIGISSKRGDSLRANSDRINVTKNRTQDSTINVQAAQIALLIKQHRADSLAIEAIKKTAASALTMASQYSRLSTAKDMLTITVTTPGNYIIDLAPKLKSRIAALESNIGTSGGASRTVTIEIK